ncbi:MAG: hypothetical protein EZS26_000786 [Candidatus Ordinivivax streblomastigis]|uniref:Uncharacterized protein n=1 Tax=Candidatus Ordinivivax streblomastigis TaxID=2540710 RepID=A0A5M8P3Z9_9BACT|nr:MAG: hypothetical protein EZS26_000786 [Candidatus Ordinivivax streblomastigis]
MEIEIKKGDLPIINEILDGLLGKSPLSADKTNEICNNDKEYNH